MNLLNRLLGIVGLNLRRTSYAPRGRAASGEATLLEMVIGQRRLIVPADSELCRIYGRNPDYMSELGRVARQVYAAYPDMVAVDVGANFGDTASIMRSGCAAPIICIDGDPAHAAVLAENARRIGSVTIRPHFLSDVHRTERMMVEKAGWNATLVAARDGDASIEIEFHTLDELLSDVDRRCIKLLKVDTEGFDPKVLRGARRILDDGRPVILFEHNRENLSAIGEDDLTVFHDLREAGYDALLFWDMYGRLMLGTSLVSPDTIADLHGYVGYRGARLSPAGYLDVCAFLAQDRELAQACLASERRVRDGN